MILYHIDSTNIKQQQQLILKIALTMSLAVKKTEDLLCILVYHLVNTVSEFKSSIAFLGMPHTFW